MNRAEENFLAFLKHRPADKQIEEGQFFGFRCLKAKGKPFVILSGEHLVFRLDEQGSKRALALAGSSPWNPFGHLKRNWIEMTADHAGHWRQFFDEALQNLSGN